MADPVAMVLERGAARVTGINETTRDRVQALITEALQEGAASYENAAATILGVADRLERGIPAFGDYRAELIARTEVMDAYNATALNSYSDAGITEVQAIDGDQDEECAARDGQIFSVAEADTIEDHPNGTLDWVPVIGFAPTDVDGGMATTAVEPTTEPVVAPPVAAETPATIININGTAPVSDAFDSAIAKLDSVSGFDKRYRAVGDKVKSALRTIDKTFKDGNLPKMPEVHPLINERPTLQGAYKHLSDGTPVELAFVERANMETVFHEIGHFIDQRGLGYGTTAASRIGFQAARGEIDAILTGIEGDIARTRTFAEIAGSSPQGIRLRAELADLERSLVEYRARGEVMEGVAQAIIKSDGYQALLRAKSSGEVELTIPGRAQKVTMTLRSGDAAWIDYAIEPEEVYARAMGQYLSKRHGTDAIKELDAKLYDPTTGLVKPLADQWDWADFEAIDRAITKMLRDVGWLVE